MARTHHKGITGIIIGLVVASAASSSAFAAGPNFQADGKRAAHAVLVQSDFPAGWAAGPAASTAASDAIRAGIPACKSYQSTLVVTRAQPRAVSSQFTEDNNSVNMFVAVFPTAADAKDVFKSLKSKTIAKCLRKATSTALAQSGSGTKTSVSAKKVKLPKVGDAAVDYEITTDVSQGTAHAQIHSTLQVVRVGRAIAVFSLRHVGTQFPDLRYNLVRAVVDRLRSPSSSTATATQTAHDGTLSVTLTAQPASGSGSDSAVDFVLRAEQPEAPGALAYQISYGDGATDQNVTAQVCRGGTNATARETWRLSHRYSRAGTYSVGATVTASCTPNRATAELSLTVVGSETSGAV
jgi:hypothetical protein